MLELRRGTSILFFVSSYSPLALIILLMDINPDFAFKSPGSWLLHPTASVGALIIGVMSVFILLITVKQIGGGDNIKIIRVANQSGELVNYSIPYMISFFGFDLGNLSSVAAFLFFLVLMYVLTGRTTNCTKEAVIASDRRERGNLVSRAKPARLPRRFAPRNDMLFF